MKYLLSLGLGKYRYPRFRSPSPHHDACSQPILVKYLRSCAKPHLDRMEPLLASQPMLHAKPRGSSLRVFAVGGRSHRVTAAHTNSWSSNAIYLITVYDKYLSKATVPGNSNFMWHPEKLYSSKGSRFEVLWFIIFD